MKKNYFFFYVEIALQKEDDYNIYAYENVSHIPTRKLIDIFDINLEKDPHLLEGYFLTKESYSKHIDYINENIGQINLDVFEYCLRQYATDSFDEVRKLYKENMIE